MAVVGQPAISPFLPTINTSPTKSCIQDKCSITAVRFQQEKLSVRKGFVDVSSLESVVFIANYVKVCLQQALSPAPCIPKIWKRYVDDSFTFLSRDNVDNSLQHLNSDQQFHFLTHRSHGIQTDA